MAGESINETIEREEKGRVTLKYTVETNGAPEIRKLPMVVGVLADLSGHNTADLPELRERKFEEVDRDNINAVMKKVKPRVDLQVENRLEEDDSLLGVSLAFESMKDFEPERIVEKVEPLKALMEVRRKLKYALNRLDGNDELKRLLQDVVATTEAQRAGNEEEPRS